MMRAALWKQIAVVFVSAVVLSFLTASLFSDDESAVDGTVDVDSVRAMTPNRRAQAEARQRELRRREIEARAQERDEALAMVPGVVGPRAGRLGFVKRPYWLEEAAAADPFHVLEMWHDGRFTWLRTDARQRPVLYEQEEPGGGGLLPLGMYLATDGLYVVDGVARKGGWMQIGNDWAESLLDHPEDGR